jgi:CheY-like chemotaxis protein
MPQPATRLPHSVDDQAEGHHPEHAIPSARHAQQPMVRIHMSATMQNGDTGIMGKAQSPEGKDATEKQDAVLTKDEAISAPSSVKPVSAPKNESVVPVTAGKPLALVVEDTVELGEVIQATLEGMGIDTAYATHGKTGLEKLKEINPTLLLMDIGLPDITGWKMLDNIKEHYAAQPDVKMPAIIVITAYGDPANRLIGKLQGIYSYLLKPFTPDEIEKLVRLALSGEPAPEHSLRGDGRQA